MTDPEPTNPLQQPIESSHVATGESAVADPSMVQTAGPAQPIAAGGSSYYRSRRYIIAALIVVIAVWFGYDGWKRWPTQNEQIEAVNMEVATLTNIPSRTPEQDKRLAELSARQRELGAKHDEFSIRLQKILAVVLPFVALGFLGFILHRSRGQVRLEDDTLHAPGHPPVPLPSIANVDGRLWRKKGIAYVDYETAAEKGRLTLDAFIYDPKPMDEIYEVIARRAGVWEATKPVK